MTAIKRRLIHFFCIFFGLSVCLFLIEGLIGPVFLGWPGSLLTLGDVSPVGLVSALFLFSAIVCLFFLSAARLFSTLSDKNARLVSAGLGLMIVCFEAAVIIGFRSMLPPAVDGGHVYLKAIDLATGSHLMDGSNYFQIYPNNIPVTVLRYWIYRYVALGHEGAFLLLDRSVCALFLNVGIFFSWKIIVRLLGRRMGILFLTFVLACLPLFFYTLYFYSDTVAIMFPPFLLYMWLRLHRTKQLRYLLLLAVVLAIGCQIRQNLILFVPALIIYMCFVQRFRKTVLYSLVITGTLFIAQAALPAYYAQLGLTRDEHVELPMTHWIMLGLGENGRYHVEDLLLSLSAPSKDEKKAVNLQEIRERLEDRGPQGMLFLWLIKSARTFADGSMGYYWYTGNSGSYPPAYDYLFGDQKQLTVFVVQVFHLVNLFFLALSALRTWRLKKVDAGFLIQICLFGSYLFYTFLWEAEPRYAFLFVLFTLMGAVFGLDEAARAIDEKVGARSVRGRGNGLLFEGLAAALVFGLVFCAALNYEQVTQQHAIHRHYVVNQDMRRGKNDAVAGRGDELEQTFKADGAFDHVSIGIGRIAGEGLYELSVREQGRRDYAVKRQLSSDQLKQGRMHEVALGRTLPANDRGYVLRVRRLSGAPGARMQLAVHGKGLFEQRDMYPGGNLSQNDRIRAGVDLQFQVYRIERRAYMTPLSYFLFMLLPASMLFIGAFAFGRSGSRLKAGVRNRRRVRGRSVDGA